MYGVLKVLYGSVNIQSYSLVSDESSSNPSQVRAIKLPLATVNENDGPVILSPRDNNIHEIWPVEGSSASFIDVLAPPYNPDQDQDCHYYRDDGSSDGGRSNLLTQVSCPTSFWCDSLSFPKSQDIQHLKQQDGIQ